VSERAEFTEVVAQFEANAAVLRAELETLRSVHRTRRRSW
jgi:hypothetical protein